MNVILQNNRVKYSYPKKYNMIELLTDGVAKWKKGFSSTSSTLSKKGKSKIKLDLALGKDRDKLFTFNVENLNKSILLNFNKDIKDLRIHLNNVQNHNSSLYGLTKPRLTSLRKIDILKNQISKYRRYDLSIHRNFDRDYKKYLNSKFPIEKAKVIYYLMYLNNLNVRKSYKKYLIRYKSLIKSFQYKLLLDPLLVKVGLNTIKKHISHKNIFFFFVSKNLKSDYFRRNKHNKLIRQNKYKIFYKQNKLNKVYKQNKRNKFYIENKPQKLYRYHKNNKPNKFCLDNKSK